MKAVKTDIVHGSREWLMERRGKINISTASSILYPGKPGVYGTPYTEYMRITSELDGKEFVRDTDDNSEILEWGTMTEMIHLDMIRKRMPNLGIHPNRVMYRNSEYPFVVGTPDAMAFEWMDTMIIETKAPVYHAPWEETECPTGPMTQAMLYASMFETTRGSIVSALIPPGIKTYALARNPQWEEWAWMKLEKFWNNHIIPRVAPEPTDARDLQVIESLPREQGLVIKLDEDLRQYALQMEEAKRQIKELEEVERTCRIKILSTMGDAETGLFEDGSGYSYIQQTRNSPAREATTSTFRVFRKVKK